MKVITIKINKNTVSYNRNNRRNISNNKYEYFVY